METEEEAAPLVPDTSMRSGWGSGAGAGVVVLVVMQTYVITD